MLFIFGTLNLGGVETFFMRLAKQRFKEGKSTKMILLSAKNKNNLSLIKSAEKYAELYFFEDISNINIGKLIQFFPFHLSLLLPLRKQKIADILSSVKDIHVGSSFCGYFAIRMLSLCETNRLLTVGLYHSLEFTWGGVDLPYFERNNRKLFFQDLDKRNLIFFNDGCVPLYEKYSKLSFKDVNLFPIGVVDIQAEYQLPGIEVPSQNKLKIISVGRLVSFKSYNLWMIGVIARLKEANVEVEYFVYGDGPIADEMKSKIEALNLQNNIFLKGKLDYNNFSKVVSLCDIFIGSGTAIVEAAGIGVPSIVAIENNMEPYSYGYLSDVEGFTYHEDGLYPKVSVLDVLMKFITFSDSEKSKLKLAHIKKSEIFSMQKCSENFSEIEGSLLKPKILLERSCRIFRVLYSFSFLWLSIKQKIKGSSLSEYVRIQNEK
jgi:glycosyltransferase involved in cell wall biosynthesis